MEVPKKKSLIEPLITTAAVLGTIQGLVWVVLSFISILLYEEKILPGISNNYTGIYISRTIFDGYLSKDIDITTEVRDIIIGAKQFNYFMYFYLILSFSLLVISAIILWAAINGKSEKSEKTYTLRLYCWTINMTILSLLDLILVCIIGHDYHKMENSSFIGKFGMAGERIALASAGIVMTLAARGFVVWIINVIFVVILGKHLYDLKKKETIPNQSHLNAYNTGSRPPWDLSNSPYADSNQTGYNNKGFKDDNDNPMIISSSQSFTHLPVRERDNYASNDRGNQKLQPVYNNPYNGGLRNNGNNLNGRDPNGGGPYAMGGNNSPLRPLSLADRTPDVPNQWAQPTPFRTAKIGRQGGQRSPPLNVNPPFIPDPDYSPPGSPRVRGVLRPKSNYAMY